MRLRLWRLLGARRGRLAGRAIAVEIVVETETGIVVIAIMIRSVGDIVMKERMIADVVIIGASVGTDLGPQLRRSDPTVDTAASETVNTTVMTVIAERIDAEVIMLDPVETTETATAMVNETAVMTAVTTEKEGAPTPVKLETETRVPNATVIRTTSARDPHDVHLPDDVPLSYTRARAVTTVAMETDETPPAETTIIATTHTTETVGHLLPALRLTSQTPNSKRRIAFASLQKCNQMQTSLRQNAASELLSLLPKNKSRRRQMISSVLTAVNLCPRYISVCKKTAWTSASGAVVVDCPRWRRIEDSESKVRTCASTSSP
jgi:hypothetical protein